ncbi:1-acyl-sn-glycerol-3-phosphate acyltransferase [Streptomyces sp. TLI_235]|nr:lysophospholipid acyltransferase family protein [Streptomyces sp. TLI_235]PBC71610.1 1-acyl-sn-glycerol-3-phosphate acyltransferase [Streptomyces sp. TLI_235]
MAGPGPSVGPGRQVLRGASCAALLLAGVALTPVVRTCCGPALRERLVRRWARLLIGSLGVRLRVGPAPRTDGGVLLVANHVSWLDILLVAAVRPGRMLAKTEVRAWPLIGPLAARAGTLFLDRDRLRALPGVVDEIAAALRRGERMAVFPEGSTWCGRRGGRFRPAVFEAAVRAGATVQPVALGYRLADGSTATVAAFVGADGLLASLRRVVAARGLVAEVAFRAPIPAGTADRRELAAAAQAAVFGTARIPAPAVPADHPVLVERPLGAAA